MCDLSNLTFPSYFFEDEVREGFFVTSMMKRYWASQLKVLSFVAQICERHNIRWFAEYGTLLGAVRHAGYVPWDDDLDICMFRPDFERFFDIASKELPDGFQVLTLSRNSEYDQLIGRVVNCDVIDYGQEHMAEYYGCPYTVGIDIFPLDGICPDQEKEKSRKDKTLKVLKALSMVEQTSINEPALRALLIDIEKENNVHLKVDQSLRKKLMLLAEQLYSQYDVKDCEKLALMPFYIPSDNHIFPKELYKDIVKLPFENIYINVPGRYDELLSLEYGEYLQVNKSGGVHNYPVYADQEQILRDHIGRNPYRYTLDPNDLLRSVQRYVLRLSKERNDINKKIAVFLPCKAKWWSSMEPLWKKYTEDPNIEIHVLPIFYYDSDFNGNIGEKHDERSLFPEYVHVEDCEKFDFEKIHPNLIVTQVPYDGYSTFMSVHEFFYSANLQNYTDELIYVPYFMADSPLEKGDKAWTSLSVMVEQEAVINADKVILYSEEMRKFYIDKLIELCGEDTRNYWEQKIQCTLAIAEEGVETETENEWQRFLGQYVGRKVIIYHISIAFLLRDREKSIDKIRRSLEVFAASGDKVCAIIVPQKLVLTDLQRIDKELWQQYIALVKKISATTNCIYDESGLSLNYMDCWNGYYGDATPLVRQCVQRNIPVMIENIDI